MANPYQAFRRLIPRTPLLVGSVVAVNGAECRIELDDGGLHVARGEAEVEDRVYFRPGGAIEGPAPAPTVTLIEL